MGHARFSVRINQIKSMADYRKSLRQRKRQGGGERRHPGQQMSASAAPYRESYFQERIFTVEVQQNCDNERPQTMLCRALTSKTGW